LVLLTGYIIENCRHFFSRKEKNWLFATEVNKPKFSLLVLYYPWCNANCRLLQWPSGIVDLDIIRWSCTCTCKAVVIIFSIHNTKLEFGKGSLLSFWSCNEWLRSIVQVVKLQGHIWSYNEKYICGYAEHHLDMDWALM
jgi:hypothetical protein